MQNDPNRRRIIIVMGIIALLFFVAVVILFSPRKSPTKTTSNSNTTGSTSSTTTNSSLSEPDYQGTDQLLSRGFSTDELSGLKFALYKYSAHVNKTFKQISFGEATHLHDATRTDMMDSLVFNVTFDNATTLKAKVAYSTGDTPIQLTLSDTSGNQVFDSGVVKNEALD